MSYFLISSAILITCVALYAVFIETKLLKIEKVRITTDKKINGGSLRILHLSDLHYKEHDPWKMRVFKKLSGEQFDLILISGDSLDEMEALPNLIDAVGSINTRLGTYYVFGNHDHFSYSCRDSLRVVLGLAKKNSTLRKDIQKIADALEKNYHNTLHNRNMYIGEANATIVGVDDMYAGKTDVKKACLDLKTDSYNILLAHNPDSVMYASDKLIDLALCGHTHGGQVCFPFIGAFVTHSILPTKKASGLVEINGVKTYVSRGLSNFRFLPFRFLCRPEITVITVEGKPV
ncbi:metallophosphoesterase [Candidatus Auribacterota bacterium]